jgi:hypothetical protein
MIKFVCVTYILLVLLLMFGINESNYPCPEGTNYWENCEPFNG